MKQTDWCRLNHSYAVSNAGTVGRTRTVHTRGATSAPVRRFEPLRLRWAGQRKVGNVEEESEEERLHPAAYDAHNTH